MTDQVIAFAAGLIAASLIHMCGGAVQASDETAAVVKLNLARMCVNEAGFSSPRDCAGIWQVTRNVASSRSMAGLLDAQRRLSPRVTGMRDAEHGNARWTRALMWGDAKPSTWPTGAPWVPSRWARVRGLAARLVAGTERRRVCPGMPIAWGGTMDDWIAERRGLVLLDCGVTLNRFWGRP